MTELRSLKTIQTVIRSDENPHDAATKVTNAKSGTLLEYTVRCGDDDNLEIIITFY